MEWQNFLNLCICQESHLQHVEDYRWVSLWAVGCGRVGVGGAGGMATRAPAGKQGPGGHHGTHSHCGRQDTS